jgi:predicted GIY-YIG superfamily endonuclease
LNNQFCGIVAIVSPVFLGLFFWSKFDLKKQEFIHWPMLKPFFTYILRCSDDSYYVGSTDELENRVAEHNHGEGCAWTKSRLPVTLEWSQEFPTREEAREAEHQIKRWSRAKKKALIAGDFNLLRLLAGRSKLSRAVRDASK